MAEQPGIQSDPWSNDPVLDQPGEICYLRDEDSGELWSATPFATNDNQLYSVNHGRGFTRVRHERHGISQEMTISVPPDDPVKLVKLRLQNKTAEQRHLSVTYYAEWVLGVKRQESAPFIFTEWDDSAQIMLARNAYQETFRDATAFLGLFPQPKALSVLQPAIFPGRPTATSF